MTSTYRDRMIAYADRVVSGEETAGRYEKLACERLFRDLAREGTDEFPYVLDDAAGARACRFMELLPHIKGEWAKPVYVDGGLQYAKIKLEDWQIFAEYQLFGWKHRETGLRRFRRSYEEIARKNAKSTRVAARELYLATADGEPGAHCYSVATTGEQAREVFDVARNMALRQDDFRRRFGVEVGKNDITMPDTASSFKPLNSEGSTLDGLNVHGASVDEVHAHKTRTVWDVLDSATGARSQALISAITTAGFNLSGICTELRDYSVKVLESVHVDETWFCVIFTIDEGDEWHDPKVWRKANPNLGISVKLDDMEAACRKAKAQPAALANFLTKRLNVWVSSGSAWMDMQAWHKCRDAKLRLESRDLAEKLEPLRGKRCYIALDLAEKRDFAAMNLVFPDADVCASIARLYLNQAAVDASGNAHLQGWCNEGHVIVNDGNLTDLDNIKNDLLLIQRLVELEEVAYDPAKSMYFATKLLELGLPMVEIGQTSKFYTQPMIVVLNQVQEGKFRHDGNPCMTWMISNVVAKVSQFTGLKHPVKERDENKIDGAQALLMAHGRAFLTEENFDIGEDYELCVV